MIPGPFLCWLPKFRNEDAPCHVAHLDVIEALVWIAAQSAIGVEAVVAGPWVAVAVQAATEVELAVIAAEHAAGAQDGAVPCYEAAVVAVSAEPPEPDEVAALAGRCSPVCSAGPAEPHWLYSPVVEVELGLDGSDYQPVRWLPAVRCFPDGLLAPVLSLV